MRAELRDVLIEDLRPLLIFPRGSYRLVQGLLHRRQCLHLLTTGLLDIMHVLVHGTDLLEYRLNGVMTVPGMSDTILNASGGGLDKLIDISRCLGAALGQLPDLMSNDCKSTPGFTRPCGLYGSIDSQQICTKGNLLNQSGNLPYGLSVGLHLCDGFNEGMQIFLTLSSCLLALGYDRHRLCGLFIIALKGLSDVVKMP